MAFNALPVLGSFFTFGQVQFGYQFLTTLQRNIFAVVVVVFYDVLLIFGMLGHGILGFC